MVNIAIAQSFNARQFILLHFRRLNSTVYPFPISRPHSRVASRAASPALSTKSRKSTMSARNLPYRHSYMEQQLTDDESSESITSYMDDINMRRKGDRRDSAGRSIRSSRQSLKSSPQRSFDDDSETFSRRNYRHSARERRASSSARSAAARPDRRSSLRVRSDSTQDSETEMGTKALVQAKIREKVAQASSMDESSSDLWKPKSTATASKTEKATAPIIEKEIATADRKKEIVASGMAKTANKVTKPVSKPTDRRKSVEKVIKPKTLTDVKTVAKSTAVTTTTAKTASIVVDAATASSNAEKSQQKQENGQKEDIEPPKNEEEPNDVDLASVPDITPDGPPKTPDYEWTCEYCTFENQANVKICAVCCKTPSLKALRKQLSPDKDKKPPINGKMTESAEISKEGRSKRISRKISFWPGTKAK